MDKLFSIAAPSVLAILTLSVIIPVSQPFFFSFESVWSFDVTGPLMWFWHSSIWVFRWVSYRSFNLLPGFMKRNVFLIFHFDNFLFDLPFRATSHIRWMIAITICTFCFIFALMIVMFSLSTSRTFWLVLAVPFVVAIFPQHLSLLSLIIFTVYSKGICSWFFMSI